MSVRGALAVLLSVLLAVPAAAIPSSPSIAVPIGICSYSDSANIGNASALPGTTVFSGDFVQVGPRGSAAILLNSGMQVRVSSASRVQLTGLAGNARQVEMEIFSGAARFRTSAAAPVVARLADATARAKGSNPAVGVISLLTPKRAIIGAETGELLVSTSHDGRSITLREGETVELTLADVPAQGGAQQGSSTTGAKPLTGAQIAIIGVTIAAVVTGVGLWLALHEKGLTDQEKKNLVSPFQFP